MKLVTYEAEGVRGVGVFSGGEVYATGFTDMKELIASGSHSWRDGVTDTPVRDAVLCAPLPRPGKMLFCGVNFRSHLDENPDGVLPETPFFFSKLPTSVIGPDEAIRIPEPASKVDWEVELAVIIGRRVLAADPASALDAVFGYTVVNDVSSREVQFKDAQITLGKGFDTHCPMGPWIVTADEIGDPSNLDMSCTVNGEPVQGASTADLIFSIPEIIAAASKHITLEPGDIVTTGTPAGVGLFAKPPRYLKPGDEVVTTVSRVGSITNPVVAGWPN